MEYFYLCRYMYVCVIIDVYMYKFCVNIIFLYRLSYVDYFVELMINF